MQPADGTRAYDIGTAEEQRLPLPRGWVSTLNAATRLRIYRNHERMCDTSEHPYLTEASAAVEKLPLPDGWIAQEVEVEGEKELYFCHPLHRWSGWDHPMLRACLSRVLLRDKHVDTAAAVLALSPVRDTLQKQETTQHAYSQGSQHDDGSKNSWVQAEEESYGDGNDTTFDGSDGDDHDTGDEGESSGDHNCSNCQGSFDQATTASSMYQMHHTATVPDTNGRVTSTVSLPGHFYATSYASGCVSTAPMSAPLLESTATLRALRTSGWYHRTAASVRSTSKHSLRPTMSTTAKSRVTRARADESRDEGDIRSEYFESLTLKEKQEAFVAQLRETDGSDFSPRVRVRRTKWVPGDTSFLAPKKSDMIREMNLPERATLQDQQRQFMAGLRKIGASEFDAFSITSQSEHSRARSRRRLRTSSNPPVIDAAELLEQHGVRLHNDGLSSPADLPLQDLDFVLARVHAAMGQTPVHDEDQLFFSPPSDITMSTHSAEQDDARSCTFRDSTFYSERNGFHGAPTTISSRQFESSSANKQEQQFDSLTKPHNQPQVIEKTVRLENNELIHQMVQGFQVNKYGRNKRAQRRVVRYDIVRDAFMWDSRKTRDGIALTIVSAVHKGLASDNLKAAPHADPNRSLSVHCLDRTLDLEAPTQQTRDLLYRCIQAFFEPDDPNAVTRTSSMRWKSAAVFVSLRPAEDALFHSQSNDELGAGGGGTDLTVQPQHDHLIAIVLDKKEWHALRLPDAQAAIFCLRKGRRDRGELSMLIQCNDILFESSMTVEPLQLPVNFPSGGAGFLELPAQSYRRCEQAYYRALADVLPLLAWALQHGERVGGEYRGVRQLQETSCKWSLHRNVLRVHLAPTSGCLGAPKAAFIRTVLAENRTICKFSIGGWSGQQHDVFSATMHGDIDGLVLQAVQFILDKPTTKRSAQKYTVSTVFPLGEGDEDNHTGMQRLVAARSHDAKVIRFSALVSQVSEDLEKQHVLPKLSVNPSDLKDSPLGKTLGELLLSYDAMSKAQRTHVADMFAVHHAGDRNAIWILFWAMQRSMWAASLTLDVSKWAGWKAVLADLLDSVAIIFKLSGEGESSEPLAKMLLTQDTFPNFSNDWGWCVDAMDLVTPSALTPKNRTDLNGATYWVLRFLLFALRGANSAALTFASARVFPCLQLLWEQRQCGTRELVPATRAVCQLMLSTQSVQSLDAYRALPTLTRLIGLTERIHGGSDVNNWNKDTASLFDNLLLVFQSVWAVAVRCQENDRDENLDKVCETMYRIKCSVTARQSAGTSLQKQLRQIECRLYDCIGVWCAENVDNACSGSRSFEGMQCFSLLQLGDLYMPNLMQAATAECLPPNFMEGVESYTQMLTKLAYVLPWIHRDLMTFRQKWVQPLVDMLAWMMCASAQPPQLKVAVIMAELLFALSLSHDSSASAFLLGPELIEKLMYIVTLYRDSSGPRSTMSRLEEGPLSVKAPLSPGESFQAGEQIDGLYKMKSRRERWFPGVVQAVHSDGTMDIMYDDGELTVHKPANEVRKTKRRSMRSSRSSRDGLAPSPTPSNDRVSAGDDFSSPPMRKSALVANDMLQRSLKAMHRRSVSHSILEIHSTTPSVSVDAANPKADVESVAENGEPVDGTPQQDSAALSPRNDVHSESDSDDALVFSIPAKLNKSASLADLTSPVFSNKVRLPDNLRFIRSSTQCGSAHSLSSALVNTDQTPGPEGDRDRRDSYFTRGSAGSQRMLFEVMAESGGSSTARARAQSLGRPGSLAPAGMRVWNTWDALADYFKKKHGNNLERGASLKSIDTATSKLYSESSENDVSTSQRQQLVAHAAALVLLGVINANHEHYHINPQLTDDATFDNDGEQHSAGPILFGLRDFFQSRNGHDLSPVLFDFAQQRGRHFVSLLQLLGVGRADKWISSQTDTLMRIADGAFGSVFTLHAQPGAATKSGLHHDLKLAIKRITRENSPFDRPIVLEIFGEVSCLKRLQHERSVCKLVDFFPANSEFWIVLEHCEYSARFWRQRIGYELDEAQLRGAFYIFTAVCGAIASIHAQNVIHFDIKCDNVLLRGDPMPLLLQPERLQDLVCICDFGESLIVESDQLCQESLSTRSRGTLCIQSPEILSLARRGDKAPAIGFASDIWSLGCALYELLTGEYLFRNKEWTELFATLCSTQFQIPRQELDQCESIAATVGMQNVVSTIFGGALKQDPKDRHTGEQLHRTMLEADTQLKSSTQTADGAVVVRSVAKESAPQQACIQLLQAAATEHSSAVVGGVITLQDDAIRVSFQLPTGEARDVPVVASRLSLLAQTRTKEASHNFVICDTTHSISTNLPPHAVVAKTHNLGSIQQSVKLLLKFLQSYAAAPGTVHLLIIGDDDTPTSARTAPWQRPSIRCSLHTQLLTWAVICAVQAVGCYQGHADIRLAVLQAWSDTRSAISTDVQLLGHAQAVTDLAYVLLSNIDMSCK